MAKTNSVSDLLWYDYTSGVESSENTSTAKRTTSSSLDKDAFLKLMMTQLQYQDPLNPVDDKQFLSQMAQFTSLEQMQNMNTTLTKSQAFSMIGKTIEASYFDQSLGSYVDAYGMVTAVNMKNGEPYLEVDGLEVPFNKVENVYSDVMNSLNNNVVIQQNLSLMGKCIQAITTDKEGNPSEFVEGIVDYVKFDANGTPILVVGDKEVYGHEVQSVADDKMLIGMKIDAVISDTLTIYGAEIKDVVIKDKKAYLVADGHEILIDKINYATDALNMVGKNISYKNITGKVDSVIVRDGLPYLVIGDKELSFLAYKGL